MGAQINTSSPYSRYGLGERAQQTLAHNQGMGGAFVALKADCAPGKPVIVDIEEITPAFPAEAIDFKLERESKRS